MSVLLMESFARFERFDPEWDNLTRQKYIANAFALSGYRLSEAGSPGNGRVCVQADAISPSRNALTYDMTIAAPSALNITAEFPMPLQDKPIVGGFSLYIPDGATMSAANQVMRVGSTAGSSSAAFDLFYIRRDGLIGSQEGGLQIHPKKAMAGRLNYYEFRYDPSTGEVRVWLDDVYIFAAANVNTLPSANRGLAFTFNGSIIEGWLAQAADKRIQIANIYTIAEDAMAPNVRLGPSTRVVGSRPNVDAAPNDFSRPPGFDHNYEVTSQSYQSDPENVLRSAFSDVSEMYRAPDNPDVAGAQLVHAVSVRNVASNIDSISHTAETVLETETEESIGEPVRQGLRPISQFKDLLFDANGEFFEAVFNVPGVGMVATSRTMGTYVCKSGEHNSPWTKVFEPNDDFAPGRMYAIHPTTGVIVVGPARTYAATSLGKPENTRGWVLTYDPSIGEIDNPAAWVLYRVRVNTPPDIGNIIFSKSSNRFVLVPASVSTDTATNAQFYSATGIGTWSAGSVMPTPSTVQQSFWAYPLLIEQADNSLVAFYSCYSSSLRQCYVSTNGGQSWAIHNISTAPGVGTAAYNYLGPIGTGAPGDVSGRLMFCHYGKSLSDPFNGKFPGDTALVAVPLLESLGAPPLIYTRGVMSALMSQVFSQLGDMLGWENGDMKSQMNGTPDNLTDSYVPHKFRDGWHYVGLADTVVFKARLTLGDMQISQTTSACTFRAVPFAQIISRVSDLENDLAKPLPATMNDFDFTDDGELVAVGRGIFTQSSPDGKKSTTTLTPFKGITQSQAMYHRNPQTGQAWTPEDANDFKFGLRIKP